jgi:hypothetical protein
MHAVVVQVTINDFEPAREFLQSQIVPRVSQAPGFVAGYWARSQDDKGLSMVVFDSQESAETARQMIEGGAGQEDAVTLDSVDVCEVVAHA